MLNCLALRLKHEKFNVAKFFSATGKAYSSPKGFFFFPSARRASLNHPQKFKESKQEIQWRQARKRQKLVIKQCWKLNVWWVEILLDHQIVAGKGLIYKAHRKLLYPKMYVKFWVIYVSGSTVMRDFLHSYWEFFRKKNMLIRSPLFVGRPTLNGRFGGIQ